MTGIDFRGLHVLADDGPGWPRGPVAQARAACEGGAAAVQLRIKHASDREAIAWGDEIRRISRDHGVAFVINDRADWAQRCGADAVHLGQEDLAPNDLTPTLRDGIAIGRSTHDPAQARAAVADGVDYVAFGPLFGTATKETGYDARGLSALSEIVAIADPLPVIAIGGIDARGAARAIAGGAAGVAVISEIAGAADPVAATRRLVDAIGAA